MKVSFAKLARPASGAVAVAVADGGKLGKTGQVIDRATGGALSAAMKAAKHTGQSGKIVTVYGPPRSKLTRVVAFGVGKAKSMTAQSAEETGGALYSTLSKEPRATIVFDDIKNAAVDTADIAAAVASGIALKSYRFDKYRTTEKASAKPKLTSISVALLGFGDAREAYKVREAVNAGVLLTRDLVSEPPNVLTPVTFAARAKDLAGGGLKVKVIGRKEMEKMGMGALLGVAQGSIHEPKLVVFEWNGAGKNDPTVAFVGKGVCFDSGGISLKPGQGMWDMKWDMGGAGVVTGLFKALAGRKAKVNAVGILGLVENMPDANAQRPGDVVTSADGQTIEVLNTDAEGRLVLADALWYVQEHHQPDTIVDLATLTGAIIAALAEHYAGLFSDDDDLSAQLTDAGLAVKERLWRMPIGPEYDKMINSPIADMKNLGGRYAGATTAAQFVKRFIRKGTAWAHLDIAGVTWAESGTALAPKGGTGYGVRLLNRFVEDNYER
ncbi:MAG: leucyl aminopeptidase [Alphaproteobacteria bacterium]|nr:leucyl aminopeptidase [Alphaproteobacteria bacterium]